jgi:transposase-like protein
MINTREIAEEYRLTHWAGIMRSRTERGLTVKAFCEQEGFHENVYYYWQKRLREAACEQLSTLQVGQTKLTPFGFTEVKLEPATGLKSQTIASTRPSQIRIEFAGARISTDSSYPLENLAALLRELRP